MDESAIQQQLLLAQQDYSYSASTSTEIHHLRLQILSNASALYPILHNSLVPVTWDCTTRPGIDVILGTTYTYYDRTGNPHAALSSETATVYPKFFAIVHCNGVPFIQGGNRSEPKAAFEALLAATAELVGMHASHLALPREAVALGGSGGFFVATGAAGAQGNGLNLSGRGAGNVGGGVATRGGNAGSRGGRVKGPGFGSHRNHHLANLTI